MNKYVADTMAFILRLEKRKMPHEIKSIFIQAENGLAEIRVPAIVFAELGYLSEKGKIDINLNDAHEYLEMNQSISVHPLSFEVIEYAFRIDDIPELHDRLIAATAKAFNVPILTNDSDIKKSLHVEAFWE
ncbi:MAG: PIN domain-containing protein [Bacteroidetes bacterium]|nr:PIN domain-containing protein [Bacteroidota bacterium]